MPDPPASGSLDTEAGWDFLAAARALTPRIAAAGEEIDAQRRLPPSLVEAMVDAGLFRMLLPRLAGGAEAPLPTFLTVVEEVARADGSCAWCLAQACVSAAAAVPYYDDGPVRQLFGDRRLVMANGTGSSGRAVAVPGGYRVTAEWPFASGCTHATWLKGVAPVYDAGGAPVQLEGGSQELRLLLFPASAGRLLDTWHVSGLRGTGSHTITLHETFIPAEQTAVASESRRRVRWALDAIPADNLFAAGFASVAMGLARGALEALIALASTKSPRGTGRLLAEDVAVQLQVGQAEATLRGARAFLHEAAQEVWHASTGATLDERQRMLFRLAATSGIHAAARVVDVAYGAAGATAIFASHGFERRFRDVHAVTQQTQARRSHLATVGRFLLGSAPQDASVAPSGVVRRAQS